MILGLFHAPSKKEEDPRNRMVGSVQSTSQKVERIHELICLYASFMLSLHLFHYQLCGFNKDYDSPKQQRFMVLLFSVSFMLPQRRNRIRGLGWEVRFGQHFRRSKYWWTWIFVCFFYAIITLSIMRFLQGLCFYKDAILYGFMILGLYYAP